MSLTALHRTRCRLIVLVALCAGTAAEGQIAVDRSEMVLRPDSATQRSGVVMVRNTGRARVGAVIRIEDWDRGADGAHRFYEPGTQPGSCATVLTVTPTEFTLAPDESRAVEVGLDGAVRSACWSVVLIESEERVRDESGTMVLATVRTGMKVFAEPSDSRAAGEISEVEVEHSEAAHSASSLAAVTFRNTGDRHLKGAGHLEIRGTDERVLATVPLPMLQALPGAAVTARVPLPASLRGPVRLRAVVEYGGASVATSESHTIIP